MKKVILTRKASSRLEELFIYLETEWSVKVKNDFVEKFEKAIFLIQKFPKIAQKTDILKNLHKYVVTNQTSIFYRVNKTSITIIALFDNRMNPAEMKNLR